MVQCGQKKNERWLVLSVGTLYYYDFQDAARNNPPWYRKGNAEPKNDMKDGVVNCSANRWHAFTADGTESSKNLTAKRRAPSNIGGDDSLTVEVKSPVDETLTIQFENRNSVNNFMEVFQWHTDFYSRPENHSKLGRPVKVIKN